MTRIRVDSKAQLRQALETIILKKLEKAEQEHEKELEKAELEKQAGNTEYYNFIQRLKPVAFEFYPIFKIKLNIPWVCPDPISDWYFLNSYWQLYNQTYVSPPSCIAFKASAIVPLGALCIKPGAYPINEGKINSWMRISGTQMIIGFFFRNQGPGQTGNTYQARANLYYKTISFMFQNSEIDKINDSGLPGTNTWFRRQLKFYISEDHLIMRWEKWSDDNWVQVDRDAIDKNNYYYGGQTNYAGLSCSATSFSYAWYDDTEIWKAS